MTNEDRLRDFWLAWGPLYRSLRPEQAKYLLKNWPLFQAVAWGQVDLTLVFAQDFSHAELANWPMDGNEAVVREFNRKVRALIRLLADQHPGQLKKLPSLMRAMSLFAAVKLNPDLPLISAMAADFPVPASPASLYQLLLACEFGEYSPEIYHLPWEQFNQLPRDVDLITRLVRPVYDTPQMLVAQIKDMGQGLGDFRTILRFARHHRDLGEQELVVVALRSLEAEQLPAYTHHRNGTTKLGMLRAERLNWRAPGLRVLTIRAEHPAK